jgi:hypothetical protein
MGPFAFSIPGNGQHGAGRLKSWAEHPNLEKQENLQVLKSTHLEKHEVLG